MTTIAKIANGTLLKIGDGTGTEAFTTVPEVMKLSGPTSKFDLMDVTSHDSSGYYREFIPGLLDGDTVKAEINMRFSNTLHKGIRVDNAAATKRNFKIVFPDSSDNTCLIATYITGFPPVADIGQPMRA